MPDTLPAHRPALAALLARASVPARLLLDPGPDDAAIDLAVAAALRAPDHGGLRPWRFVVIRGAARAALGEVLAQSLSRRAPDSSPDRLAMERAKPLRAPVVIVAGAALRPEHPVPVWEQEACAAAGVMNLMNALDAQGLGAIWLSSAALRDDGAKAALGFAATDVLLGWIYAGTPAAERPRPARPGPEAFWREWHARGGLA
ncbi:nitroreductase family protein [Falsiroseomonas stagni]|uniref:Putative NAD(P)H nitroreductase n=1 Tax=Falsiroseomonas stagni DSM 19981 TaxID=1123062 RepID=A0A1I4BVD7_9PROT|nr:nitroreductase [Falsiroseomonas stagni]SFK72758.1 Nitroreductase [Falsiroseomonas stagni DSM 19981]